MANSLAVIHYRSPKSIYRFRPEPNAYCEAISGVCVGIPYLRTETYDTLHTYRTLAVSESVAPVHAVYFGRARALMRWGLRVPEGVHLQGLRLSRELRAQSVAALTAV